MISVIIPTHNRDYLIRRAINSVLCQDYSDIEIIVISDGSTDKTNEIVEEISQYDNRVKFIHYEPSQGSNYARNVGIDNSKGEYIAFLDDDDEWVENKLMKQWKMLNSDQELGFIYTGVRCIYVNEGIEYLSIPYKSGNLANSILLGNCIGTTSSAIVRREVLEEIGKFDLNLKALQDYDLWIRICQVTKVGVISEALVKYYNYTNGIQISSITDKYEKAFEYINNKYKNKYSCLTKSEIKDKKLNEIFCLCNKTMRNGEKTKAINYALRGIKTKPCPKSFIYLILTLLSYKMVLKIRKYI